MPANDVVYSMLARGVPHSEILQQALQAGEDRKKVCLKLAYIADAPLVQEYKNDILVLMGYLVLLSLLSISALVWLGLETSETVHYYVAGGAALILALMLYALLKNRAGAYLGIVMLTVLSSIQGLKLINDNPPIVITCMVLNVILIVMAVRLKLKLFPRQNFFNTRKDAEGYFVI